jgi:amino acid adenylation domain-containing protein
LQEREHPLLLHQYLENSAVKLKTSAAIADGSRIIPFSQLWQQSRSVATILADNGLRKGDRVVLMMPKSAESITSLFAVLMSGGIYVPLDLRWPPERIEATIKECSPRFVIADCDRNLLEHVCSSFGKHIGSTSCPMIVPLSGDWIPWDMAMAADGESFVEPNIQPDDPALILFTSGSTGQPKGVTLSHRAVGVFVRWASEEFRICEGDRIACPSPLSFDLSTLDVYSMALRGAACVIVPESISFVPKFLTRFLSEQKISIWYSVPSLLSSMLLDGELSKYDFPELRLIAFAGEVFPTRYFERWRNHVPTAEFYNLYGPTETNVITWYHVPSDFDCTQPIPIGKACPYAELAMEQMDELDPEQLADRGLLAAGESLMLEYWNRHEETEKAFVERAGCHGNAKRFYRTGDRVVMNEASGEYIFVGRRDRQVKRRGYRIELREIERALESHSHVLEVAVISSQDSKTTIAAFVRCVPNMAVSQVELRIHCARFLPSYMIPDQIIPLPLIPKGSRGKVDYGALSELLQRS